MGRTNPGGSSTVTPDTPVPIPPRTLGGSLLPPSPSLVGETPFVNKVSTTVVGAGAGLSGARLARLGCTLRARAAMISRTMFDNAVENIAEGVVSAIGVGEWLEGERLQPTDIAIFITKVFKPATVVQEVLKDIMRECLHSTIRMATTSCKGNEKNCHREC